MPLPERKLIERIQRLALGSSARAKARSSANVFATKGLTRLALGIGDDCAVLSPASGCDLLATTDLSVEGTHFRREWHPAKSVGHRYLARGLSDIAAMGGRPVAAFLSLAVPQKLPQRWVDDFLRGLFALAAEFDVTLAGGDIAQAPLVAADITVLGEVPAGKAILRSGARPGHLIYVTGSLGGSAHTLGRMLAGERIKPSRRDRHFFPRPRISQAEVLREIASGTMTGMRSGLISSTLSRLISSMIDTSDGLSVDLAHICERSGVGAEIDIAALPLAPGASLDEALHGGEDYELLFTAQANARVPLEIDGVPVTPIGRIMRGKKMFAFDGIQRRLLRAKGWQHFQ